MIRSFVGASVEALPTPCAVVLLDVVERNCRRMAERASRLGLRLRPHVKTHKCVEAARLQTRGHFGGITVSTLAEARFFAEAGFRDVTWALPLDPRRLPEVGELARRIRLNVLLDSEEVFQELRSFAADQNLRLPVFLKVDCGYGRAGVDPRRPESARLAAALATSENLDFRGLLTHGGHAYDGRERREVLAAARQEAELTGAFAEQLRREGLSVPEVSIGSTPGFSAADDLAASLEGGPMSQTLMALVTEARPGNYVFFDGYQAAIGSCGPEDVGLFVLSSVIGAYPHRSKLLLNAGGLALSQDPGPGHVDEGCGYGRLLTEDGKSEIPGAHLVGLSQEHGHVRVDEMSVFENLRPGDRLRILPNHSCLTAALHERYFVVRDGEVVDEWEPVRGW